MNRRPSTQDVTWFLDLNNSNHLDLDPPYQRKSVWTLKDKRFFLDTIFNNYPCPPIFLHKTLDEAGTATYHVVDGKQRLQTIIAYVNDEFTLGVGLGTDLDGKYWRELSGEMKRNLWDYVLSIDYINDVSGDIVNDVFDRINRNQRKLERQELRHAKYGGWLVTEAEREAQAPEWARYRISTTATARRMRDVQFISELMLVLLEKQIRGFDQDDIDLKYAEYDDPSANVPNFSEDEYKADILAVKQTLTFLEDANGCVTRRAKSLTNFYTLWSLIALHKDRLGALDALAERYDTFMAKVEEARQSEDAASFEAQVTSYLTNARGASTDLRQRKLRLDALVDAILPAQA